MPHRTREQKISEHRTSEHRTSEHRTSEHRTSEHCVQLFDDSASLAETVAAYLCEGWNRGEGLLVVARPDNWERISHRMKASRVPVSEGLASGRLVVLDAAITLSRLLRNGYLVHDRFTENVVPLIRDLTHRYRAGLRIYGEMVDILTARSEFPLVFELEGLWNDLAAKHTFMVLCGYSSTHFGDARRAPVLREICKIHHHASAKPTDLLGTWLLAERQSRFHTDGVPRE